MIKLTQENSDMSHVLIIYWFLSGRNGDKSSESSGAESDGSDKLAPGIERKNSSSSLFSPLPFPFDYEQKKLLAMKGMAFSEHTKWD